LQSTNIPYILQNIDGLSYHIRRHKYFIASFNRLISIYDKNDIELLIKLTVVSPYLVEAFSRIKAGTDMLYY